MAKNKKKTAKKPVAKKPVRRKPPVAKKHSAKKHTAKKHTAPKPTAQKHTATKPVLKKARPAPPKTKPVASRPAPPPPPTQRSVPMEKPSKKNALRDSILKRKTTSKPIAFSLDEVRAIAQTIAAKSEESEKSPKSVKTTTKAALVLEKPAKPNHVKAASLADILGFNPKKPKPTEAREEKDVPEKFRRYYKLLIELRQHLTEGIQLHSEETLKRSSKDDSGDLSSYGQHMADAGTDTFDRDFALSLVSSEQEALTEIDAAIKRIFDGTYGICEVTQKPIAKERLLAVPFTRYSAEAQKELEKNRYRARTASGLFGELGEEGGKIMDEDGDE